ncbi:acyl--CoA ligase [Solihabitans fulvus]|uniref:Acyl--CoA ligase n=1 Tax=Solihabitans fulvus TaxID=1892852 RepID=A0A5B2WWN7_9PSEU|nr:class I adenylate-forming enzyme family protein [Solihabitans fulvus]KAA2255364.1 acyl--CoA ligase [Solihabitans fulvus]
MTGPTLLHHLLDRAASARPDAPSVDCGTATLTFGQLDLASRRLAGFLAELGARRGDRVVVCTPPDVLVPALLYGCARAGAVFSVVHEQTPEPALAHVLDDCEPAVLVTDDPVGHALAAARGIRAVTLAELHAAAQDSARQDSAKQDSIVPRETPVLAVDPVCLIYTSGSTGRPKAVVSTHAQAVFAIAAIESQLAYRPDDVVFCALPQSFDYGLYQLFLATSAAARLRLASAADAGPQLLRQLTTHRVTVLPAVPAMVKTLARLLSRPGAQPPPLRLVTNTGAAMPEVSLRELRRHVPGLRVQLMFGLTECKRATIMPPDEDLRRPGACGKALPGTEVFVVDEDGGRLPVGEIGEIVVRGPNVMAGYWRRPELTAQRFHLAHGLFPELRTGDYGRMDEDGYLYFSGRRDDLYKERGFRVSVTEVQAAAYRVPGVQAAAVLAPTADRDSATLLVVTDLAPEDVLAGLRAELEDFKVPRQCLVVPEIPLTPNGKVDRAGLLRLVEDGTHV